MKSEKKLQESCNKVAHPLTTLEAAKIISAAGVCREIVAIRNLHLRRADITYIQFSKGGKLYFLESEILELIAKAKEGGEIWR